MSEDVVSLRDFVERLICDNNKMRDALREADHRALDEYKSRSQIALDLKAAELERRLDLLNHAHTIARDALNTYVSKSVYERDQVTFSELRDQFHSFKAMKDGSFKGVSLLFSIGSALSAIMSVSTALYVVATR